MKNKRVTGLVLLIVGIALYGFSRYISGEVDEGHKKIHNAQKTLDQAHGLSQTNPYTKDIGDLAAGSVQKKIDEGKHTASSYQELANWLFGSGVVIFIIGGALFAVSFIEKRRG